MAADFVREFKAFCNTVAPVGNLPYYSKTITGLAQYCDQETKAFAKIKTRRPRRSSRNSRTRTPSRG